MNHGSNDLTRQLIRELKEARRNSTLFQALADSQSDQSKAELFSRISRNETAMANHWANLIGRHGEHHAKSRSISHALYSLSARLLPSRFVSRSLRKRHRRWLSANNQTLQESTVISSSKDTADVLDNLSEDSDEEEGHPEHGWLASQSGALRAGVLGMNDGLVSNFSLTMGIAGATADPAIVLVAGLAGLLAGALSMAAGEYISVKSQNEYYANLVRWERVELALWHERETDELAAIFVAKGLEPAEATTVAERLMVDPDVALDTHVREELGVDPDVLGGSPWAAATSSLLTFAAGAAVPIFPYFFGFADTTAIVVSAVASLLALFAVGYWLGWVAGSNTVLAGVRMTLIGAGAAAFTYVLGTAVGTQLTS